MSEHDVSVTEQTANMSLSIFPETPPWQYARLEDPSVADFEYDAAKLEQSYRVEQSYRDEATESDKKPKQKASEDPTGTDDTLPQSSAASWEEPCRNGVIAFRASKYQTAVKYFDEAIGKAPGRFQLYDSRAAALEKLGNIKHALRDSRKTIDLAPDKCHGYLRSAYLFLRMERYDSASSMARFALERVGDSLPTRRMELEELQRTISEAKKTHNSVEPKKSSISGLPVELISEVFLLSTEMDAAFPALACVVSSRWRAIASSMPSLWKFVTLSHRNPAKKLILWMERSKHSITALRIRNTISWLQLHDVLGAFQPSILKSLKSVHCVGDVQFLADRLLRMPTVFQCLDLEDIYLSVMNTGESNLTSLSPFIPLDRMSNVRSLNVDGIRVDWSAIVPRLSQLRNLVVRGRLFAFRFKTMCSLLSGNPHLEKLIIDTSSSMSPHYSTEEHDIVLSELSHLELVGPVFVSSLLARLSVPSLKRLVISRCPVSAHRVLLAFKPSCAALTELSLHTTYFAEAPLASVLQTMSGLTKLEITHSGSNIDIVVDAIADSYQVDGETKLVCPALEHVDFSYCSNLNGGPIARLVKSRLPGSADGVSTSSKTAGPTRIQTIYIDGCLKVDPSLLPWLKTTVNSVSCVYMTKREAKGVRQY